MGDQGLGGWGFLVGAHGFDFQVGFVCGFAATGINARLTELDFYGEIAQAQHFEDVGKERVVAIPADFVLGSAIVEYVADGGGGDGDGPVYGRGVEAGMKAEELSAVGAGAFREKQDWNGAFEAVVDDGGDRFGAGAAGPVDEDGSAGPGEGSEEGPAGDLGLGDEVTG